MKSMNIQQSIIVLVLATSTIVAGTKMSSMARSHDPSRSSECFTYYIPLIDEIAKSFQRNHAACLKDAQNGRSEVESATLEKRLALAASSNNSCELLSRCSRLETPEEIFECYSQAGSENSRTMYNIDVNSTNHLADLKEEFRLVENKEYKCTNETQRNYEKESTKAYADFNKCNLGIIDVPKPTEAPVVTETTKNPETSELPESSTVVTETSTESFAPNNVDVASSPKLQKRSKASRRYKKQNFN